MELTLHLRTDDAKQWCARKAATDSSLRSIELRPNQSLYDAFKSGNDDCQSILSQKRLVASVTASRHRILKQQGMVNYLSSVPGRLLVVDLGSTMYDGLASNSTNGFYDESDAPPWDTWVGLMMAERGAVLIAWIPQEFVDVAERGREVSGGECIHWLAEGVLTEEDIQSEISKLIDAT